MIALLQRVTGAWVDVDRARVAEIGAGLLVFVGVERADTDAQVKRMLQRVLGYRIFEDGEGRMNLSLIEARGGLLLVPQFTLAADTDKGMRPSFTPAAPPQLGERLFTRLVDEAGRLHSPVASGIFGATMQVGLINDGPATFRLQV